MRNDLARRTDLLEVVTIDQCEGKDASNYTLVDSYSEDSFCSWNSDESSGDPNLIACSQNGQKSVSTLKSLAESQWPAGGKSFQMLKTIKCIDNI